MDVYFEIAERTFMRLSVELENMYPDIQGWQLDLIRRLCLAASESEELYRGVCNDEWLRTRIILENPRTKMTNETYNKDDLLKGIIIHSNVLPCQAWWKKLQGLQLESFFVRLHASVFNTSFRKSTREFYSKAILEEARQESKPLLIKVEEWKKKMGGKCHFTEHLRSNILRREAPITLAEVPHEGESLKKLGSGNEGEVWKVLWHNGTFVRKSYKSEEFFSKEHDIAGTVFHPNIVHAFGFSRDTDNKPYLYMELLDTDLFKLILEKQRIQRMISLQDKLDILIQVASAMKCLHENKRAHGDLKSDNILISHFKTSGNVQHFLAKVTDFGRRWKIGSEENLHLGGGGGHSVAPEVLKWRQDKRKGKTETRIHTHLKADVYCFGLVAYEVLTGEQPYNGNLAQERWTSVINGTLKPSNGCTWQRLKHFSGHPHELIALVEECWDVGTEERPSLRPSFPKICDELTSIKSTLEEMLDRILQSRLPHELKCH